MGYYNESDGHKDPQLIPSKHSVTSMAQLDETGTCTEDNWEDPLSSLSVSPAKVSIQPATKQRRRGRNRQRIDLQSSVGKPVDLQSSTILRQLTLVSKTCKAHVQDWLTSFHQVDPRYQILHFFNDVAREGIEGLESEGKISSDRHLQVPLAERNSKKVGVFSVWRPTSNEAIRKLITGEGVGKGLDIKGKSALRGKFSGFVPYLQINNNEDKAKVCARCTDARVKIFYPNEQSRDAAFVLLSEVGSNMVTKVKAADKVIKEEDEREQQALDAQLARFAGREEKPSLLDTKKMIMTSRRNLMLSNEYDEALWDSMRFEMSNPEINKIDDYSSTQGVYGLDVPEKLFWEGYVVNRDISVEEGGELDSGRVS